MDEPTQPDLPNQDLVTPPPAFVAGPVGITEHDIESAPLETNGLPPAAAADAVHGLGLQSFTRRTFSDDSTPIPLIPVETPGVTPPKQLEAQPKKAFVPPPPIVAPALPVQKPVEVLPPTLQGTSQAPVPTATVPQERSTLKTLAGTATVLPTMSQEALEHKARELVSNGRAKPVVSKDSRKKKAVSTAIIGSFSVVIIGAGLWIGANLLGIPGITDIRRSAADVHGQPCTVAGEKTCDSTGNTSLECTAPGTGCNAQATGSIWCETSCGTNGTCEEGLGCMGSTACTLGTKTCQGNSVTTCVAPGTQGNSNPYNAFVISRTCIGGIETCSNATCQVSTTGAACNTGTATVDHGDRACYSYTDCRVCDDGSFSNNIGAGSPGCPWPCDRSYEAGEITACPGTQGCTENFECQQFDGGGKTYLCGYDSINSCKTCVDQAAIPACTNDFQCPGGYRCMGGTCQHHTYCQDGCCDVGSAFPGCYVNHYTSSDRDDPTVVDTIITSGVQRACIGAQTCGAEQIDVACPPNGHVDSWSERYDVSCDGPQPTPNLPQLACDSACSAGGQACPSGQACLSGRCRNPQCASETDCSCTTTEEQLTCDELFTSEAPALGSSVSFRCSADRAGANHFEFRYRINGGAYYSLREAAVGSGQSQDLQILQAGSYEVQCRVCKSPDSSDCTTYQSVSQ